MELLGAGGDFKIGVGGFSFSSLLLSAFWKSVENSMMTSVAKDGERFMIQIEEKNTFWKSIEISASVFPLVSGTALAMNTKPVAQNNNVLTNLTRRWLIFGVFWSPTKETVE